MASIPTTKGKPISCKAAIQWELKKPYTIETIEVAPPQAREVRVRLVAAGICHTDLYILNNGLPNLKFPMVPGHEGAGIVESVGEGVVSVNPGDKVFTMFLSQCKKCKECLDGRSNQCLDFWGQKGSWPVERSVGYDGKPRFALNGEPVYHNLGCSSFSEYVVVPESSCIKVNPRTPLETACIMSCGFSTGYGSSNNFVDIRPGDKVAVWGLGCVGLAAVAGCKDKSAGKIIGIDINSAKEDIGHKFGCTDFINSQTLTQPLHKVLNELTGGDGLDFAFICSPIEDSIDAACESLCYHGITVVVGTTNPGKQAAVPCKFFFPQRSVTGSLCGGYKPQDDIPKLVNRYLEGKLPVDQLITHKLHLERINDGLELLKSGRGLRTVVLF